MVFETLAALSQLGGSDSFNTLGIEALHAKHAEKQAEANKSTEEVQKDLLFWDRIMFSLGVVNIGLTPYILGAVPTNFYLWHTPKALYLITDRAVSFYSQRKHLLLLDFCYWVNWLSLVYCWFMPKNQVLFQILFLCSNGPLAWSVVAFNQSLIFHSRPHMTSVFIHISPALLVHGLRWYQDDRFSVCPSSSPWPECDVPWHELLGNTMKYFYIWWIVVYYLVVFVLAADRIKRKGLQTLYDRVTTTTPLAPILNSLKGPEFLKQAVYMGMHLLFGIFTMSLATLYWRYYWLNLAFIFCMPLVSAWNASGFYFSYFSKKYQTKLKEKAEAAGKQQ